MTSSILIRDKRLFALWISSCILVAGLLVWPFRETSETTWKLLPAPLPESHGVWSVAVNQTWARFPVEMNRTSSERRTTSEAEFAQRRLRAQHVCSAKTVDGIIKGVFPLGTSAILYCFVPKAGCTFWKRIYIMMKDKVQLSKDAMFSLPRLEVHDIARMGSPYNEKEHNSNLFPTRFISTRDPFSRLISTYLDKVYLPDFWGYAMESMLREDGLRGTAPNVKPQLSTNIQELLEGFEVTGQRDFLREHFEGLHAHFREDLPLTTGMESSVSDTECGKFGTFLEFMLLALSSHSKDREDQHWQPIHEICNPCAYNVTHIGRMDTFANDARAILTKMGEQDALADFNPTAQVDEEIEMLVHYYFNRTYHYTIATFYTKCVGPRELAFRMWHNFRWRGYIHPEVKYFIPEYKEVFAVKKDLFDQLRRARKYGLQNPELMKRTKQNFKEQAYLTLPESFFEKVVKKYELDIALFGYENERDKMYTIYNR